MSIKFGCPHCQKLLQVKDDLAGKKVKCPGCQKVLDVPAAIATASAPKASEPPRPASAGSGAVARAPTPGAPPRPPVAPKPAEATTKSSTDTPNPTTPPKTPAVPKPGSAAAVKPAESAASKPPPKPTTSNVPPPASKVPVAGNNVAVPKAPLKVPAAAPATPAKPAAPVAKGVAPPASVPVARGAAPPPTAPPAKAGTPARSSGTPSAKAPPAPVAKGVSPPPAAGARPNETSKANHKPATADGAPPRAPKAVKKDDAPPIDEDDLVASMLADEPKEELVDEGPPEGAPITFNCFLCDEQITMPAELGGKQAQCPACRRIIKVPLPIKVEAKDWRKVDRRIPAGARQDMEPEPEGAWGTATGMTRVSAQSLLEAEAIPTKVVPVTVTERISKWTKNGVYVGLVILLSWGGMSAWSWYSQKDALQKVWDYDAAVNPKKYEQLGAAEAGVMHRDLAEFNLRRNDSVNTEEAVTQYRSAASRFAGLQAGSIDRDLYLLDVALAQLDLGGTPEQQLGGVKLRLKWDAVQAEVQRTLQLLKSPEVCAEAVPLITRKLITRSKEIKGDNDINASARAEALVRGLQRPDMDLTELRSRFWLEMLVSEKKNTEAEAFAIEALKLYQGDKKPPVAPSLIALLCALDKDEFPSKRALALQSLPGAGGVWPLEARLGYAMGAAHAGKWEDALKPAIAQGDPSHRLQALLAVAAVAIQTDPKKASEPLGEAITLIEKELKQKTSSWQFIQLVRLASHADVSKDQIGKVMKLIDELDPPPETKGRCAAEHIRGFLLTSKQAETEKMKSEAEKKTAAHPQALEMLARHNARYAGATAVQKAIALWDPEALRAAGYAGVALGVQDSQLGQAAAP